MNREIKIDAERVHAREVEGEIVILDTRRQRYIGGNPSVNALWPLLERGATREQLIETLLAGFEVDRERADADLTAFLNSLGEFGLLLEDAAEPPAAG